MQAISSEDAVAVEVVRPEGVGRRVNYIGSPGIIDENPQAFLVDRLYSGARINPHFHDIDQFQVVVDGYCTMGKRPAAPVSFQYADAYTPYGPIVGEEQGFAFFTLRPIASGGFFAMPGNRQNMKCRAGRNLVGQFDTDRPRPASGVVVHEVLMATQDDGANAVGIRLGPGASAVGLESDAGGQYYLVCEGEVTQGDQHLPRRSLIHVAPGEASPTFHAGEQGADILLVQFARPSERPGSDPQELAARDPDAYMQRPENGKLPRS